MANTVSRFSPRYWRTRVFRPVAVRPDGTRDEAQHFFVRVGHAGRREAIGLGTNDREAAARKAAALYAKLKAGGWDRVLREFRRETAAPKETGLSVGEWIALASEYAPNPPRTATNYAYALRRVAADIAQAKPARGKSRFDPCGAWREQTDTLALATLTPVAVEDWMLTFLKPHRGKPLAEQKATRSMASYLRNARALFSRRVLDAMRKHNVPLPNPIPFADVRLAGKAGSTRYHSTIDARALLRDAQAELAESDPDAYAVILLALGAGLRRSEIDALQWQSVMPDRGIIRVQTTAQRHVKSEESEGDVVCDAALFVELEKTRRPDGTLYVVQPSTEHPPTRAAQFYRCKPTFDRVTAWLKAHGVLTAKPLHTLRKEFGSLVADAGDIHQAMLQLRHAQISTTEAFYADRRHRATVGVGAILNSPTATSATIDEK
ncbi:MAG TPA: site-specific integrase [Verrucomicrobiota bacterium]|nr:site-specific integrase [Verrucomicrobiota bacterium]